MPVAQFSTARRFDRRAGRTSTIQSRLKNPDTSKTSGCSGGRKPGCVSRKMRATGSGKPCHSDSSHSAQTITASRPNVRMPNQSSAPDVPRLSVSISAAPSRDSGNSSGSANVARGSAAAEESPAVRCSSSPATRCRAPRGRRCSPRSQPQRPEHERQRRPGEPRQILQIIKRLDRRRSGGETEETGDALSIPPKRKNGGIAPIHRQRPRDQQRRGNQHGEPQHAGVTPRAPVR